MKKYLAIVFLFISIAASAQSWVWVKAGINNNSSSVIDPYSVSVDNAGNTFETGTFKGNVSFGAYSLVGSNDLPYVVKYDVNGNVLWAKSARNIGKGIGDITASITDQSGNVYITGTFNDTLIFSTDTLFNGPDGNIFIAKYDPNGNLLWAEAEICKPYSSIANSISIDKGGNIYITGYFNDTISFDTIHLKSYYADFFITKLNSGGKVIWAKSANILSGKYKGPAVGQSMVCDSNANIYITGQYTGSICFDSDTLKNGGHFGNIFLVKYDSNGNTVWAKGAQSSGISVCNNGTALAVDPQNNIYMGGNYSDTVWLDSVRLMSQTNVNIFIAKYSPTGKVIWAKSAVPARIGYVSSYDLNIFSMSVDNNSNLYMCGTFTDTLAFNSLSIRGSADAPSYILRFDSNGMANWGTHIENDNDDNNWIAFSQTDKSIYFTGDSWYDTCRFGSFMLNGIEEWAFLGKLSCDSAPLQTTQVINHIEVIVFPNPSTGIFTLQIADIYQPIANGKIEVYNILGEKIMNEPLRPMTQGQGGQAQGDNKIDLSAQPTGIYLYRVTDEYGQLIGSGKLIKE